MDRFADFKFKLGDFVVLRGEGRHIFSRGGRVVERALLERFSGTTRVYAVLQDINVGNRLFIEEELLELKEEKNPTE